MTTKTFNSTDTNTKAFYDILHQQGVKDEEIDGSALQKPADDATKKADAAKAPPPSQKDGKISSQEVVAFVVNNFTKYQGSIQEHFKKLGVDISWIKPDGTIDEAKKKEIIAKLSANGHAAIHNQVPKSELPKSGGAVSPHLSGALVEAAYKTPEFGLLSVTDQEAVIVDYLKIQNLDEKQIQEVSGQLKQALVDPKRFPTVDKKIGTAALLQGRKLLAQASEKALAGDTKAFKTLLNQAKKVLIASIEMNPAAPEAQLELAQVLMDAGDKEGAKAIVDRTLAAATGTQDYNRLIAVNAFLEKPENIGLLPPGQDAWSWIGDNLCAGVQKQEDERLELAKFAYTQGSGKAQSANNETLLKELTEKIQRIQEFKVPYSTEFGPPPGEKELANPAAYNIYMALKAQGVTDHAIDQGADSGKEGLLNISTQEVFNFIGNNLDDKRVQEILSKLNLTLSEEDKKQIKEKGFAKFMADGLTKDAQKLDDERRRETNWQSSEKSKEMGEKLLFAQYFEPNNPDRFEALAWFFSSIDNTPAAMDAFASAAELDPNHKSKVNADTVYDNFMSDSQDKLDKLTAQGNYKEQEPILRQMLAASASFNKIYPDRADKHPQASRTALIHHQLAIALKKSGRPDQAQEMFKTAKDKYKAAIDANPHDAAYCIQIYRDKGNMAKEMGDFFEANKSFMLAAQCEKLRVSYDPKEGGSAPDLRIVKHQRLATKLKGGGWSPPVIEPSGKNPHVPLGNYLHLDVHKIVNTDGDNALPASISILREDQTETVRIGADLGKLDSELEAKLKTLQAQEADFGKQAVKDKGAYREMMFENLREQANIHAFFGRTQQAEEIGKRSVTLQDQVALDKNLVRLTAAQKGSLLNAEGLNEVSARENKDQKSPLVFSQYVKFGDKVGTSGGRKIEFTPEYEKLPTADKLKVVKALIASAERNQLSSQLAEAPAAAKLFFEANLAKFDGDTGKAKEKYQEFVKQAGNSSDPKIKLLAAQASAYLAGIQAKDGENPQASALKNMRVLLAPLMMTLKSDAEGGIDLSSLSKDSIKSFEEFRDYLAGQTAVDGMAFSQNPFPTLDLSMKSRNFNFVLFSNYQKILSNPKHEKLLRLLYKEFDPARGKDAPEIPNDELQKMFRDFQKDMIRVSESRFVSTNLNSVEGRKRLREILKDPDVDKGVKADLLEEIVGQGHDQKFCGDGLYLKFQKYLSTWGADFNPSDRDIENAKDLGLKVLSNADITDKSQKSHVEKYLKAPQDILALHTGECDATPDAIKGMARMVEDNRVKTGGVEQMKAKLGTFWLLLIDNQNWEGQNMEYKRVPEEKRAEWAKQIQQFIKEADGIKTEGDFVKWNQRVGGYLRGHPYGVTNFAETHLGKAGTVVDIVPGVMVVEEGVKLGKSLVDGVGNELGYFTLAGAFGNMTPGLSQPFSDLLKYSDEFEAAQKNGMAIDALDPDVAVTDEKLKDKARQGIQDLRGWKRSFWYQYEQRCFISRNAAGSFPDIQKFKAANKEIDGLIADLQKAKSPEEFEAIKKRLTDATKPGGTIHGGFVAAEMDGGEQVKQLVQIVLEMIAIELATGGTGTGAAIGRATVEAGAALRRTRSVTQAFRVFKDTKSAVQMARMAELAYVADVGRFGSSMASMTSKEMEILKGLESGQFRLLENGSVVLKSPLKQAQLAKGLESGKLAKEFTRLEDGSIVMKNMPEVRVLAKDAGSALKEVEWVNSAGKAARAPNFLRQGAQGLTQGEVGMAARAGKGFKTGFTMSLTNEVLEDMSGQLKAQPETVLDWLINATATGVSMAVTGALHSVHPEELQKGMLEAARFRWLTQGPKGALNFLKDTGMEVLEEVIDKYVSKTLHGDYSAMSWDEFRDITVICFAGGVKQGIWARMVNLPKKYSALTEAKAIESFRQSGDRIVYDKKLGYVRVDGQDGFLAKANKTELQAYMAYQSTLPGGDEKASVRVVNFESATKGSRAKPILTSLETMPKLASSGAVESKTQAKAPAEVKLAAVKSRADAIKEAKSAKQERLFTEFFEQNRKVEWEDKERGIGLKVVEEGSGKKVRQATKDEMAAYQVYEGFTNGSLRVVGTPSQGFQIVDVDGKVQREPSAPELAIFQKLEAKKNQASSSDKLAAGKGAEHMAAAPDSGRAPPSSRGFRQNRAVLVGAEGNLLSIDPEKGNPTAMAFEGGAAVEIFTAGDGRRTLKAKAGEVEIQKDGQSSWTKVPVEGVELKPHDKVRSGGQEFSFRPAMELLLGGRNLEADIGVAEYQYQTYHDHLTLNDPSAAQDPHLKVALETFLKELNQREDHSNIVKGLEDGTMVLTLLDGKVHLQTTADVKARIETARDLAKKVMAEPGAVKVERETLETFLTAVARDPKLKPGTIEARLRATLDALKALPKETRGPIQESLVRQLAEGKIEAKDIDRALGKGLSEARVAELESQLGLPKEKWLGDLLAKDGTAFKERLRVIDATRAKATEILRKVTAGGDRAQIKAEIVEALKKDGVEISTDTAKAVDSMIDMSLIANQAGLVDMPGGLTQDQLVGLMATLYLKNSPTLRIGDAELTHVPMVVKGTLDFLLAQNPNATISERRVAFVTALFHDAGKFEKENLRTTQGFTVVANSFMNNTGLDLKIRPGETLQEGIIRLSQDPATLKAILEKNPQLKTEAEAAAHLKNLPLLKGPAFLVGMIAHHDAAGVHDAITKNLITQGVLTQKESMDVWRAIERHALVSSWIDNNSVGGVGVLTEVFKNPEHAEFLNLYIKGWEVETKDANGEPQKTKVKGLAGLMADGILKFDEATGRFKIADPSKLDPAVASSIEANVARLQEIFANQAKDSAGFSPLDRAMLLGDHQGQMDIAKYMMILVNSPANKNASIHQLLLGGDRVNSVDGVLATHTDEQRMLMPKEGQAASKAFQQGDAWLREMDPAKPGLAKALMDDPKTKEAYDNWKKDNAGGSVESWLKSLKAKDETGQVTQAFKDIQVAIEKGFYQHYSLDAKTKAKYDWAPKPPEVIDISEEAVLIEPPLPRFLLPDEEAPLPRFPLPGEPGYDSAPAAKRESPLPRFPLPGEPGYDSAPAARREASLPRFPLPGEPGYEFNHADSRGNLWKTPEGAHAWSAMTDYFQFRNEPVTTRDFVQAYTEVNGKPPPQGFVEYFNRKYNGNFLDRYGHPQATIVARDLVNVYGSLKRVPKVADFASGQNQIYAMIQNPRFAADYQAQRNVLNILRHQFGADPQYAPGLEQLDKFTRMAEGNEAKYYRAFARGSTVEAQMKDGKVEYVQHTRMNINGQWITHPITVGPEQYYAFLRYQDRFIPLPRFSLPDATAADVPVSQAPGKYPDANGNLWKTPERANAWSKLLDNHGDLSKPLTAEAYTAAWKEANGGVEPGEADLAFFNKKFNGKYLDASGHILHAAPPPHMTREGAPAGLLMGGNSFQGQGMLIPHDGTVKKGLNGLQLRFNPESQAYEYRGNAQAAWKPVAIGQQIVHGSDAYVLGELRGAPSDIQAAFDDGHAQIRYQLATAGVEQHLDRLQAGGKDVTAVDRGNLSLFFSENLEAATRSHDGGNPNRKIGGLYGGKTQIYAYVDPKSGQIYEFATRQPKANEERENPLWELEKDGAGQYRWINRENPRQTEALDRKNVPADAVIVPLTIERMTGRVNVDAKGIDGAGLSDAVRGRMYDLHGFVAGFPSAGISAIPRYHGGEVRNPKPVFSSAPATVAPDSQLAPDSKKTATAAVPKTDDLTKTDDISGTRFRQSGTRPLDLLGEYLDGSQTWVKDVARLVALDEQAKKDGRELAPEEKDQVAAARKVAQAALDLMSLSRDIRSEEVELSKLPETPENLAKRTEIQKHLDGLKAAEKQNSELIAKWRGYSTAREGVMHAMGEAAFGFETRATQWEGFEKGQLADPPDGPVILDVSYKNPEYAADLDQGPGSKTGDYNVILHVRDAKDQREVLANVRMNHGANKADFIKDPDGTVRSVQYTTPGGQVFSIRVEVAPLEQQTRNVDRDGIATGSHEGYNYKKGQVRQEDQVSVTAYADGRTVTFMIDGMGGHANGRQAAVEAKKGFDAAITKGAGVEVAIQAADQAVKIFNDGLVADRKAQGMKEREAKKGLPGAVGMTSEMIPVKNEAGEIVSYDATFRWIGDCEGVVISFDGEGNPLIQDAMGRSEAKIREERTNPHANVVDQAFGGHYGKDGMKFHSNTIAGLKPGAFVLSGSDGFFENFGSHAEIAQIIKDSGAKTPVEARDALMREVMIRQKLVDMQKPHGWEPIELNQERYAEAYEAVTGQKPPDGWKGRLEGKWLDAMGNVGEKSAVGDIVVDGYTVTGIQPDKIAAHFKKDNTTLAVQKLGEPIAALAPTASEAAVMKPGAPAFEAFKAEQKKGTEALIRRFAPDLVKGLPKDQARAVLEAFAYQVTKLATEDLSGLPFPAEDRGAESQFAVQRQNQIEALAKKFGLENHAEFSNTMESLLVDDVLAKAPRVEAKAKPQKSAEQLGVDLQMQVFNELSAKALRKQRLKGARDAGLDEPAMLELMSQAKGARNAFETALKEGISVEAARTVALRNAGLRKDLSQPSGGSFDHLAEPTGTKQQTPQAKGRTPVLAPGFPPNITPQAYSSSQFANARPLAKAVGMEGNAEFQQDLAKLIVGNVHREGIRADAPRDEVVASRMRAAKEFAAKYKLAEHKQFMEAMELLVKANLEAAETYNFPRITQNELQWRSERLAQAKTNEAIPPPPPMAVMPDIDFPKPGRTLPDLYRHTTVADDIQLEADGRGRADFLKVAYLQELERMPDGLSEKGHPILAQQIARDLNATMEAPHGSPEYNAAIGRLARIINARYRCSNNEVGWMKPADRERFAQEVEGIFRPETVPPSSGSPGGLSPLPASPFPNQPHLQALMKISSQPYFLDTMDIMVTPDVAPMNDVLATPAGKETLGDKLERVLGQSGGFQQGKPVSDHVASLLQMASDRSTAVKAAHADQILKFLSEASDREIGLALQSLSNTVPKGANPSLQEFLSHLSILNDPAPHKKMGEILKIKDPLLRDLLMSEAVLKEFRLAKEAPAGSEIQKDALELMHMFGVDPTQHKEFPWNKNDLAQRAHLFVEVAQKKVEFTVLFLKATGKSQAEVDALVNEVWDVIRTQDVQDTILPYTPHGWGHSLEVLAVSDKIFESSPTLKAKLAEKFGSVEKAKALIQFIGLFHDAGYGCLQPHESKGVHAEYSGQLFQEKFRAKIAALFGIKDEKLLDEVFLAIDRHGADKPAESTYLAASDLDHPLTLVVRMADNLDLTTDRMREIQTDSNMMKVLKEMYDFSQSSAEYKSADKAKKKEMVEAIKKKYLGSYDAEGHLVKPGEFDTTIKNPEDRALAKALLSRLNESTWPHFEGCNRAIGYRIVEEADPADGKPRMRVVIDIEGKADSGNVYEKDEEIDAALYQVYRAYVSFHSLKFNEKPVQVDYKETHRAMLPGSDVEVDINHFFNEIPPESRAFAHRHDHGHDHDHDQAHDQPKKPDAKVIPIDSKRDQTKTGDVEPKTQRSPHVQTDQQKLATKGGAAPKVEIAEPVFPPDFRQRLNAPAEPMENGQAQAAVRNWAIENPQEYAEFVKGNGTLTLTADGKVVREASPEPIRARITQASQAGLEIARARGLDNGKAKPVLEAIAKRAAQDPSLKDAEQFQELAKQVFDEMMGPSTPRPSKGKTIGLQKLGSQDYQVHVEEGASGGFIHYRETVGGAGFSLEIPKGTNPTQVHELLKGLRADNLKNLAEYDRKIGIALPLSVLQTMVKKIASVGRADDINTILKTAMHLAEYSQSPEGAANPLAGGERLLMTGQILGVGSGPTVFGGFAIAKDGSRSPVAVRVNTHGGKSREGSQPFPTIRVMKAFEKEGLGQVHFYGLQTLPTIHGSNTFAYVTNQAQGLKIDRFDQVPKEQRAAVAKILAHDIAVMTKQGWNMSGDIQFILGKDPQGRPTVQWIDFESISPVSQPAKQEMLGIVQRFRPEATEVTAEDFYRDALARFGVPVEEGGAPKTIDEALALNTKAPRVDAKGSGKGGEVKSGQEAPPPAFNLSGLIPKKKAAVEAWLGGRDIKKLSVPEMDSLVKHLLNLQGKEKWSRGDMQKLISPEGMRYFLSYGTELPFGFETKAQWAKFQKDLMKELLAAGVPIHDPRVTIVVQGSAVRGRSHADKKGTPNYPYKWQADVKASEKSLRTPSDVDIAILVDGELFQVFLDRRAKALAAQGKVSTPETDGDLRRVLKDGKISYKDVDPELDKARKNVLDGSKLGRPITFAVLRPDARVVPKPEEAMVISADILATGTD